LVLAGAAACATTVDDRAQQQDEIAAKELSAGHGRHFRGPVNVVIEAARAHGNLSAEQERTLTAIARELEEDRESRRELGEKLRTSAVAIVRSGTADSTEFDQSVEQAVGAVEARMQRSADALEEIHGTLDTEQRAAVAAALRIQIDERLARKHGDRKHRSGFKRFTEHLMLSPVQIEKLKAMKKELLGEKERLRPSREELLQLVAAFEGDDFRAALNAFRTKKAAVLRDRLADAGERTDTVLSLLTPAQRELLADLIKDGPSRVMLGDQRHEAGQPSP